MQNILHSTNFLRSEVLIFIRQHASGALDLSLYDYYNSPLPAASPASQESHLGRWSRKAGRGKQWGTEFRKKKPPWVQVKLGQSYQSQQRMVAGDKRTDSLF